MSHDPRHLLVNFNDLFVPQSHIQCAPRLCDAWQAIRYRTEPDVIHVDLLGDSRRLFSLLFGHGKVKQFIIEFFVILAIRESIWS
jgi:hypothetical protein